MPDGPSRYAYVTNSPLIYIDPTGLQNFGPEAPMTRMGPLPYNYSPRLDKQADLYHDFPRSYDSWICLIGNTCKLDFLKRDKDGTMVRYHQYCLPGKINGVDGEYQIRIYFPINPFSDKKPTVVHRQFKRSK